MRLLLCFSLFCMQVFFSCTTKNDSPADSAKKSIKEYLAKNHSSDYEPVEFVLDSSSKNIGWVVKHSYRAKNQKGILSLDTTVFYLDSNFEILRAQSSKEAYIEDQEQIKHGDISKKWQAESIVTDSSASKSNLSSKQQTRRVVFWLCAIIRNAPEESEDELKGHMTVKFEDGTQIKEDWIPASGSHYILNATVTNFGYKPFQPGQYIFYDGVVRGNTDAYIRFFEEDGPVFDPSDYLGDFGLRGRPGGGIDFLKYAGRGATLERVFKQEGYTIAEVKLVGWDGTSGVDYRLHVGVLSYTTNP